MMSRKNIKIFYFNGVNVAKHWHVAGEVFAISDYLVVACFMWFIFCLFLACGGRGICHLWLPVVACFMWFIFCLFLACGGRGICHLWLPCCCMFYVIYILFIFGMWRARYLPSLITLLLHVLCDLYFVYFWHVAGEVFAISDYLLLHVLCDLYFVYFWHVAGEVFAISDYLVVACFMWFIFCLFLACGGRGICHLWLPCCCMFYVIYILFIFGMWRARYLPSLITLLLHVLCDLYFVYFISQIWLDLYKFNFFHPLGSWLFINIWVVYTVGQQ